MTTEENVFDDLDALRCADNSTARGKPRKPKKVQRTTRAKNDRYVQLTEQEAMRGFQALRCRQALVWFEILYLVWKTKSRTVVLPRQQLEQMGVSRWTKRRALTSLEKAGVIRVIQLGSKSPRVTLVGR